MEIAIVGAGISGVLTALHLMRNKKVDSVTIFERKPRNLVPRKHCSGVISRTTLFNIPYSSKFVENSYSYVDILIGNHLEVELAFDKYAIYKIDRVAHEEYLMEVVKSKGVDIKFGVEVTDIDIERKGYRVKALNELEGIYNYVVVSEGYPPRLSRRLGLKAYSEPFSGLQQELYLEKKIGVDYLDRLMVRLGFDGEFSWLIPVDERKIVVGIAGKRHSILKLDLYKKFFAKKLCFEINRVEDTYGGIVLRGYPVEVIRGGVLGIGDNISLVKSFSGGGLYPISVISYIYGENIHRVHAVRRKVKTVVDELKRQFMLYSITRRFLAKAPQWRLLRRKVSVKVKNDYFYDHHEKILAKVFVDTTLS